jgi:hypothetical protein
MDVTSPPSRRAALADQRVLVLEDNAIVAMLVEDELSGASAEVVGPALSVVGALRLIGAASGDGGLSAAVLDIDLEGEHVAPVADLLATLGAPFLFATGYGEDCDTGGHADARVLRKPFARRASIDAVEAALARARRRRRACLRLPDVRAVVGTAWRAANPRREEAEVPTPRPHGAPAPTRRSA